MVKKFGYKTPTIVALTLAGTAFSAHQANAAEQVAPEKTPTNVLDDQYALKQADDAKQTTQGTTLAKVQKNTRILHKLIRLKSIQQHKLKRP